MTKSNLEAAFVEQYGQIGEIYDENTWLERFGVFVSGWRASVERDGTLVLDCLGTLTSLQEYECLGSTPNSVVDVQWRQAYVLPETMSGPLPRLVRLKAWEIKGGEGS